MPADYTVTEVLTRADDASGDWPKEAPKYRPFELRVSGPGAPSATVELSRQLREGGVPDNKVPKPREVIFGELESTDHGWKLRPKSRQDSAPQSASNGSSGEVRTDATGTSIEAQVAAYATSYVLAAWGQPAEDNRSQLAERIDFLTSTFFEAIQTAKRSSVPLVSQPPTVPEAESAKPTDDVPF